MYLFLAVELIFFWGETGQMSSGENVGDEEGSTETVGDIVWREPLLRVHLVERFHLGFYQRIPAQ